MDSRRKNSRIILIIVFILGFVIFTQRDAFGHDPGLDLGLGDRGNSKQQNP